MSYFSAKNKCNSNCLDNLFDMCFSIETIVILKFHYYNLLNYFKLILNNFDCGLLLFLIKMLVIQTNLL